MQLKVAQTVKDNVNTYTLSAGKNVIFLMKMIRPILHILFVFFVFFTVLRLAFYPKLE